jgi:hypothetical protein
VVDKGGAHDGAAIDDGVACGVEAYEKSVVA